MFGKQVTKSGKWKLFLGTVWAALLIGGCSGTQGAGRNPGQTQSQVAGRNPAYEQEADGTGAVENGQERIVLDDGTEIEGYSGSPYTAIGDNVPDFPEAEMTGQSFERYSDLDRFGRCGEAYANVGTDMMPTEERGSIGQVRPSGWKTAKYDIVDGKYLYNRCHLIGYQLTGENANEENLITGTRYLNVDGMLPFENMVADYVKETDNHVLYRVTPVFEGGELVARGVRMEGWSVEDGGEGICFDVFVYNVQPGIEINYATGESALAAENGGKDKNSADGEKAKDSAETLEIRGNRKSKIYHCPGQADYDTMADSPNLIIFHSEEEAQEAGYRKAKR